MKPKSYKTFFTVVFSYILFVTSVFSQSNLNDKSSFIDVETAKSFAKNYLLNNPSTKTSIKSAGIDLDLSVEKIKNDTTLYYIFNINEDEGYIITTADKNLPPILVYSASGKFNPDPDAHSPGFNDWMESYSEQILYCYRNKIYATKGKSHWDVFSSKSGLEVGDILKLSLTSTWGQGENFNYYCPQTGLLLHPEGLSGYNGRTPTGCVATAMGQIMYYYKWPETGNIVHSYSDPANAILYFINTRCDNPDISYGTVWANYVNQPYDWNAMEDDPVSINYEISKLLVHAGISVDMDYAYCSSSAMTQDVANALNSYFDYKSNARFVEQSDYEETWEDLLIEEINNERPVQYRGNNSDGNGGHSFVCMGYSEESLGTKFWFNWGWEGSDDGWFLLNNLVPGYNFSYDNGAVINIMPSKQPNLFFTRASTSQNPIIQGTAFTISHDLKNGGTLDAEGCNINYYLSDDALLDRTDILLGSSVNGALNINQVTTVTKDINIENQPDGLKYILVYADPERRIHEFNETDNVTPVAITLSSPPPFLSNGKSNPVSGYTDGTFVFSVIYTHKKINALPPSEVRVVIDGTSHVMQKKNPDDNNYMSGIEFVYSISNPSTGTHYYSFGANDNSGSPLTPFPASGSLNFYVRQSAAGWDAGIDPLNTTYSPSAIKANTVVTIVTGVRNYGLYAYTNLPVRVEMRDPSGTLIATRDLNISSLASNVGTTISTTITVPGTASNGTYSISSCVIPVLDNNPANDCFTNYFYIGENLGNEQFRNTAGQQTITNVAPDNVISIGGKTFTLMGINTSTSYATMRNPGGTSDKVYVNQIRIYGSYDALIRNDAVWSSSGIGYAALTGFYAITNGAVFDNVEINANPGTSVYAYANAPGGYTFSSSNYELYSTSTTTIKSWLSTVSKVTTWARIKIKFNIPSDAPLGKTTLYLLTEYTSGYADMTRLTFYITNPVPSISSINKTIISADDQIVITGTNLGSSGTVKFKDLSSLSVQSWSSTSITCTVPQGVTAGSITVTNTNGTSNGLAYSVLSSTGSPQVLLNIPDQQLSPAETKTICDLDDIFFDPNGTAMTFIVSTNNTKIIVDASALTSDHILKLTGTSDLLNGSRIDITGTDASAKSVSTSFNINVPPIIQTTPSYFSFPAVGGSDVINITFNVTWTSSSNSAWLIRTNNTGSISFTVQPNVTLSSRSGKISVTGSGLVREIIINQDAALSPPFPLSPGNNSSDIPLEPVFTWGASTGALSYRLQLSTVSSFATTILDQSNLANTSFSATGLNYKTTYYWRVNASKTGETSTWSSISSFTTVDVPTQMENPRGNIFNLCQNYPNPFTGSTTIVFNIPYPGDARLTIFSSTGKVITVLLDKRLTEGEYQQVWTPTENVSSGVYLCKLEFNGILKSSIYLIYNK